MEAQVSVRLPRPLHKRLARAAKRLGLTRSDVVRLAVQRYLDEAERAAHPRPYDPVKDLVGSLRGGVGDLGSRHRDDLVARFRRRG
jgi:Arc/MetJ-type ribon-helix-helix transcriptional regulator